MLNAAYAYLAEQTEAADAMAEPVYRVAHVEQEDIEGQSRRRALDEWLEAPSGAKAEREHDLISYLTGRTS